jgi:hypothetical protein
MDGFRLSLVALLEGILGGDERRLRVIGAVVFVVVVLLGGTFSIFSMIWGFIVELIRLIEVPSKVAFAVSTLSSGQTTLSDLTS